MNTIFITIKTKILVLESFSNPQTLLDRIDNIDKGNIVLEKNANDENCLFVNNDDSFSLLVGVINTAMYHKDGVHLNWHGTLRLADNLGIQPKLHNNHSDIMPVTWLATGTRLTFRLTMFIMPVTWLATGTRLTFRLTMFIMPVTNNDNSFRLLIGVINTAMYHKDGVHLDWHGTLQQAET
jgi:Ni/Fe-hydrogenase subunit HybB-like protein